MSTAVILTLLGLVAPSAQFTHYEEGSCRLIGDTDLYGIGVRVSYYLAFFAGTIALAFGNSRAVRDTKKGTAVLGFALFIIFVRNALQGGLAVFEWQLLLQTVFVLVTAAFLPLAFVGGIASSAALAVVYGLFAVVAPWVYFTLADQGLKDGCELKAFIFTYFDFNNVHYRAFLKAQSVLAALGGAALIVIGLTLAKYAATAISDGDDDDDDDDDVQYMMVIFACTSALAGITTIVFTEKLIIGNNVDLSEASFASTSQLLPFLVGLSTFLSTICTCLKDRMRESGS